MTPAKFDASDVVDPIVVNGTEYQASTDSSRPTPSTTEPSADRNKKARPSRPAEYYKTPLAKLEGSK